MYNENGYFIAPIPNIVPLLEELRAEIYEVFNIVSLSSGGNEIKNDFDVINFRNTNQPKQHQAVKHLWGSAKLFSIAGHDVFAEILDSLGFVRPVLELPPLLRCDMPIKEQIIFEKHQDYAYNIGSDNSVTVWIPLQNTDESTGALLVAPGTHLKGVYPNKQGIITDEFQFEFKSCPVNFGEALIFNQKLVHQSGVNTSKQIRFSVQLRFSDLGCSQYAQRGYPINHKLTTESYFKEI